MNAVINAVVTCHALAAPAKFGYCLWQWLITGNLPF